MRIVCISDTHTQHSQLELPPADVLVHAGDALNKGNQEEFLEFVSWLATQKQFQYKLYVPGNHDRCVEKNVEDARRFLKWAGTRLLVDEVAGIRGVRFYGSPWVPNLQSWAFYGNDQWLTKQFERIDKETEVLITHVPPYGICDKTSFSHIGSIELAKVVNKLSYNKLHTHIFGHIHEGYGVTKEEGRADWGTQPVTFVNAAICNRAYLPINKPIVIEVPSK